MIVNIRMSAVISKVEHNGGKREDVTQKDLDREGLGNSFMIHVMCYKMQGNHSLRNSLVVCIYVRSS